MQKRTLVGLVTLMCISLFGIIALQYIWVSNAINVQTEKFNASVFDALNQTVYKLQRNQAANYFLNQYAPNNQVSLSIDTAKNSRSYTVPYFPSTATQNNKQATNTGVVKIMEHNPYGIFSAQANITENGISRKYQISRNTLDPQNGANIYEIEKAMNHLTDSLNQIINHIQNGTINAMTLFNQFNYELHMQKSDKRKFINKKELQKTLKSELFNRGVNLDYEFGIYTNNRSNKTTLSSKYYEVDESSKLFSCLLFPDNIMRGQNSYVLDIYFPDKDRFIMKSLSLLFGGSFLLTVIILLTFYFTLKTIVDQKKVSEIKSDFINNMTHELKTPIATINLAADNIANPIILNSPENISPFIRIIKEENQRMNKQVERVLQMSLIEKKDLQLVPISVDIHKIIQEAINKIALLVNEKEGVILSNFNALKTSCLVDEVHITNVLLNLFENAIKYCKEEPHIEVSTTNTKTSIEICVKDNGIGMSKEQQAKAFDKFFRATKGNIHNVKGFGLGLSYVKAVMIQHKGDIKLKSKLGEGSQFTLTLPLNEKQLN